MKKDLSEIAIEVFVTCAMLLFSALCIWGIIAIWLNIIRVFSA
jgi:hypothetical protein